nr:hypothetical protein [Tanacetum cinerariifolium]
MALCTNLQQRVFDYGTTKTSQAQEIISLKKRVKRLEKKKRSRTHGLKRLYKVGLSERIESIDDDQSLGEENASKQGRIANIDADEGFTLINESVEDQGMNNDEAMFDANKDLQGEEVIVEQQVVANKEPIIDTTQDINLVKALEALKTSKLKTRGIIIRDHEEPGESTTTPTSIADSTRPKAKGLVLQEPDEFIITTTATIPTSKVQDKGKRIIVEPKMPMKKKAQISLDEDLAFKLQDEEEEEERIAREKAQRIKELNIA